ncbi:MAG: hypothetical protein ACREJ3_19675, partial [Polyangiaceae bacterium]
MIRKSLAACVALPLATAGCSAILGFQDGVAELDGGDASTLADSKAPSHDARGFDGTTSDDSSSADDGVVSDDAFSDGTMDDAAMGNDSASDGGSASDASQVDACGMAPDMGSGIFVALSGRSDASFCGSTWTPCTAIGLG